jgi:outer membrane protein OmpA-like peptidoglycan-associated protein
MKRTIRALGAAIIGAALALAGCATDEYGRTRPLTDAETGVLIGAAAGAAVGAAASKKGRRTKGAVIGAVGGGIAGGLVGNYMDNQKKDFEKQLASEIGAGAIELETLPDHGLRVVMTERTSFDFDSADIKAGFHPTMDKISTIVNRYGKTTLDVVGHTDSVGSAQYNQGLSERRAQAVERYLLGRNVHPQRLTATGRGETVPRARNDTKEGRALNRRVEILIEPVVAQSG